MKKRMLVKVIWQGKWCLYHNELEEGISYNVGDKITGKYYPSISDIKTNVSLYDESWKELLGEMEIEQTITKIEEGRYYLTQTEIVKIFEIVIDIKEYE